jgi:hypothetical protein
MTPEMESEPVVQPVVEIIDPDIYVCLGTMDSNHPDCKECKFKTDCSVKTASK